MRIAVISDLFPPSMNEGKLPSGSTVFVPGVTVPTPAHPSAFDLVVVLATVRGADRGTELGGVLDHLLHRGKSVALLYFVRLDDRGLDAIVRRLALVDRITHSDRGVALRATAADWEAFFRSYGNAATHFTDPKGRVLAVRASTDPPQPAALRLSAHAGNLYVIPFHVGDREGWESHERVVRDLVDAIAASGVDTSLTEHLADLRLPGEDEVLETIAGLEKDLASHRAQAGELYRYRLLLGPLSGDSLEELVRQAVGIILEPTAYRVEDRAETFGEDFWLTGPEGDFALAEVKGINSGVGRKEINQVDNHREELERDTNELPGLLVVNVYRKDTDLTRRIGEKVHPNIVAALRRQNVTLLRSADLYRLLARRLRDEPAGQILIDALRNGGGWLEVTDEEVSLRSEEGGGA